MIFTYTYGSGDNPNQVVVIDTESEAVRNVLNWIAEKIGASKWEAKRTVVEYIPNVPDTIVGKPGEVIQRQGTIFFKLPDGTPETDYIGDGCTMVDARRCVQSPEAVVAATIHYCRLSVTVPADLKYLDPDASKPPANDWDVPGSVIGQPLAAHPGHFDYEGKGDAIGAKTKGPASGRTYELVLVGGFAFFKAPAWRLV